MVDPRAAVGNFIWSWMVYGFKGVRFVASARYRARVHEFWRVHPGRRSHGIRKMILGAILDAVIAAGVVVAIVSNK